MATIVFLLKRFVAQRLLGLAIVVTLGFTIGVSVAGPIYADAAVLDETRARAHRWLVRLGLGDRLHDRTFELSAGQQQRVAVA